MDNAWIGVVGTLLGGALVGIISWAQKRQELIFQRKQEDRRLLRSKIEELHSLFSSYVETASLVAADVLTLRHLGGTTEVVFSEMNRIQRMLTNRMAQMNTLQRLYAPELEDIWEEILSGSMRLNGTLGAFLRNEIDITLVQEAVGVVHGQVGQMMRKIEGMITDKKLLLTI